MSYVDFNSNIRWSESMHKDKIASELEARMPHQREHVLYRRMISLLVLLGAPAGHPLRAKCKMPTPAQMEEIYVAADAMNEIDDLAIQVRLDSARLDKALDYEEAQRALEALPEESEQRAALQAQLDEADADILALVAERAAFRAPEPAPDTVPQPEPQ
jgi:hypothetical protein